MQLLLKQDVRRLGRRGEVVNVTPGYGRNYLVPQGLAVEVNPTNVEQIEGERRRMKAVEDKLHADMVQKAEGIKKLSLTITARANEEGHLFGSVGVDDILVVLKEEGFDVAPVAIQLEKPIKELGVIDVPFRLHPDVAGTVKVWVVGE